MGEIAVEKSKPLVDNALVYADQLKNIIQQKGEEYFPGLSMEIEKKSAALLLSIQQQSNSLLVVIQQQSKLLVITQQLSSTAVEKATIHYSQAMQLATEYSQKAVEVSAVYTQCIRKSVADVLEDQRVQQALKYTYEMYNKALHYVGICY